MWFVGGKGGVGKTTCAAACAIAAARGGLHTLALSVDPAHSLGDALGIRLAAKPRVVLATRGRLSAAEMQAPSVIRRWIATRRELLEEMALRGTWLDREDVSSLLRLTLPGIDELAALVEIARIMHSARFDLIVVDTAPTGHTLRMLETPEVLGGIASVFEAMQSRHRVLVAALRGRWSRDAADALIDELVCDGDELAAMLRDSARTRVFWVTLAEPMAIEESGDAVRALTSRSIGIDAIVANRLTPLPDGPCRWCQGRHRFEALALQRLERVVRGKAIDITTVLERVREPVGVDELAAIGRDLSSLVNSTHRTYRRGVKARAPRSLPRTRALAAVSERSRAGRASDGPSLSITHPSARLLLFGGKGGVGKTTCAAAAALTIARADPKRRILLLSTDPAHSLSDVLGATASDVPAAIPGGPVNLDVRELDAVAALSRAREEYQVAIDELFDRLLRDSAVDATHDRRIMQGLVDLAPPGVDELMAMSDVIASLDLTAVKRAYDVIVVDTAPTGHAMRLLEMPALVQNWTQALMRILLKYQPVTGVGALGEALLLLSRGMGRLRAILQDRSAAEFIVVTRAARLPRAETERLLAGLRRLRVPVSRVIVNAVTPGTCSRCRRIARVEQREIGAIARGVRPGVTVMVAPATIPPPHGLDALTQWQRAWQPAPRSRGASRRAGRT